MTTVPNARGTPLTLPGVCWCASFVKDSGSWRIAAVIAGFLCVASVEFVRTDREGGTLIMAGFPAWWLQVVMPLGFGIIALRLAWRTAAHWRGRMARIR